MNYIISAASAALLVIGLAGNGFEMRRARMSATTDEQLATKNAFASRRNLKWYACIGAAIALMAVGTYA
ncbi:MAG TPA: hypothetical protein VJ792_02320 [Candidatus Nitrosotalea sp.]|nr:hypothetical protein [Candidatus Nitrosotalea sp.]